MIAFEPAPARLPDGHRVYAVGDVHGCLDRLRALHEAIAADMAARPLPSPLLVHLGDLVDRGADSAGVIELLAAGPPIAGIPTVNLMGNHEHMALSALAGQDRGAVALWLDNGAGPTLDSWRVPPGAVPIAWPTHIPPRHLLFLRDLPPMHRLGPYLFVHAGVRPGVALDRQSRADLLWIREPFLSFDGDLGAVVVHGHTPRREPEVRRNRVGIDTGAVMGGDLTCAVLEGAWLGFLRA
jgi:serine/threonine protein phosphatase 1